MTYTTAELVQGLTELAACVSEFRTDIDREKEAALLGRIPEASALLRDRIAGALTVVMLRARYSNEDLTPVYLLADGSTARYPTRATGNYGRKYHILRAMYNASIRLRRLTDKARLRQRALPSSHLRGIGRAGGRGQSRPHRARSSSR